MSEEIKMWHAPCGIYCKTCPGVQGFNCKGCRTQGGQILDLPVCGTYACATEKEYDFCYECAEFPCERLMPIVNFGIFKPNNSKVYNLVNDAETRARGVGPNRGKSNGEILQWS